MPRRPNILLVQSDQHRWDCLGVSGHPLVRTPHLDRLAREGTRFTHAFTPSPICSPSRASLLTGTWPHRHRCLSIPNAETYQPALASLPTIGRLLADDGWRCGWVGKFHQEVAGAPGDHGFEAFVPSGGYHGWRQQQGLPDLPPMHGGGWFGAVDEHAAPEQTKLAWECDQALALLERFAGGDAPFLLRWDPVEPHLPCRPPRAYADLYDPALIAPWGSFDETLAGKPQAQRQQLRTWGVEDWTWERWAPVVARYLAEITLLDHQVGRLLAALDRLGIAEDTLVVYTTDHGDLCGGHRMIDKHFVMYDDVVRVPLIARWPGRMPAGAASDAFVCAQLDVAAACVEAAGLAIPASFQGRSLVGIARGEDPAPRSDMFGSWHGGQFALYTQRMVRDRAWKYVWNGNDRDELYQLERDPHELRNLATHPQHAAELSRLRHRLVALMEELGDPQLNQWTRANLLEGRMAV